MSEASAQPSLVFVTDPMCSWCWGMWPELERLRAHYEGRMHIELLMGGMQIGERLEPPTEEQRRRLGEIWAEVRRVTGQPIGGRLPADPGFVYHSELPCRAVTAMRHLLGGPPFDFLRRLHEAFYVEASNLTSPTVLAGEASAWGVDRDAFLAWLASDEVRAATRQGFMAAQAACGGVLPSLVGLRGRERQLLATGYVALEDMLPGIEAWLAARPRALH